MTELTYQDLVMSVLDGDATPEECQHLQDLLAGDPARKAQFDQLQSAQRLLSQVAPAEPPAGLADAAIARILSRRADSAKLRQLFPNSSVIDSRAVSVNAVRPTEFLFQFLQTMKEKMMSDPKPSFFSGTKFKALAGGGIALAALVVVTSGIDFSGTEKNVSGTIAPAERYRSTTAPTASVTTTAPGTQPSTVPAISAEGIGAGKLGGDKLGGDKLGGDKLGGDKLGGDKLGGDKLGGDKLGGDKLGGDKLGGGKLGGDKLGGDKLGGDKLGGDKLGGDKLGGDKLGGDKLGGGKLGGDKLGGDKLGGDKLGGDKLGGDKLGGGKLGGDKLGGDKLGGDKLGGGKVGGG